MTAHEQRLGDIAEVRSKNAGPFWLTLDVFASDTASYERIAACPATDAATIGRLYGVDPTLVRVFRLPLLLAVKVSFPRPVVQGSLHDRDMHAGQQHVPLLDLPVPA
jgi:hypothetical protein